MNPDDIFSKQLKQMEKEKKEKDSRLKSQEKKVNTFYFLSVQYLTIQLHDRWTTLSVRSVFKRFHCSSHSMKNRERLTVSSTTSRKKRG